MKASVPCHGHAYAKAVERLASRVMGCKDSRAWPSIYLMCMAWHIYLKVELGFFDNFCASQVLQHNEGECFLSDLHMILPLA